jgi:hypothetical protein
MSTTTWTAQEAGKLAAELCNTAVLGAVMTFHEDGMTIQSHMDMSGWLLSRVVRHRNSAPQRAEVKITYNHGQYDEVLAERGWLGSRYVITDHDGSPLSCAVTLHGSLCQALQELVKIEPTDWPTRWPHESARTVSASDSVTTINVASGNAQVGVQTGTIINW